MKPRPEWDTLYPVKDASPRIALSRAWQKVVSRGSKILIYAPDQVSYDAWLRRMELNEKELELMRFAPDEKLTLYRRGSNGLCIRLTGFWSRIDRDYVDRRLSEFSYLVYDDV